MGQVEVGQHYFNWTGRSGTDRSKWFQVTFCGLGFRGFLGFSGISGIRDWASDLF